MRSYSLCRYRRDVSDLCTADEKEVELRMRRARLHLKMRIASEFFSFCLYALWVLITLAVASLAQTSVPINQATPNPPTPTEAVPSSTIALGPTGDSAVRLGAGDLVEVSVYNVPELNTKLRVSTNGEIYLPLINEVHIAGLTIEEAEAVIERRLDRGGFVKSPHVQIFVQEYNSEGASVLGIFARP